MKNFTYYNGDVYLFYVKKTFLSFCMVLMVTTIAWSQTDSPAFAETNSPAFAETNSDISSTERLMAVVFSLHPANTKICTGGSGSFTVAATGSASLTYQWQESIDGAITWSNITNGGLYSGATGAVLTITGPPSSMDTYRYRCRVSDGVISASNPAVLTVGPNISLINQTVTSCPTSASNLTAPGAAGVTYQWQVRPTIVASWVNAVNGTDPSGVVYAGVTTGSLLITSLPSSIDGYMYRYLADDGAGCAVISGTITQMVPALAVFAQPVVIATGLGDTATITVNVTSGSAPFTYRWTASVNGGITYLNLTNSALYAGVTTNSLTVRNIAAPMFNYRYRLVVKNSNFCATANSAFTQLMLNAILSVKLQSFTAQKSSYTSAKLQWEMDGESTGSTFTIQKSANGNEFEDIGVTTAEQGITLYSFTDTKLGNGPTRYRLKITDLQGKMVMSKIVQVTNLDITGDLVLKPSITAGNSSSLYIQLFQKAHMTFTIIDLNGRTLWSQSALLEKGEHTILLNLERFTQGLYYVQVTEGYRRIKVLPLVKR
jgi:hypothetical protein